MRFATVLLFCFNVRASHANCGTSTDDTCDGVFPCIDINGIVDNYPDVGCEFCNEDADCLNGQECFTMFTSDIDFCVNDVDDPVDCDSSCLGCRFGAGTNPHCICDKTDETPCYFGTCDSIGFGTQEGTGLCVGNEKTASGCFSEQSTCIEEKKGEILVKDVKVGDKVLTRSGQFQTVYTVDHHDQRTRSHFLQISYSVDDKDGVGDNLLDDKSNGHSSVLEVTPSHMVFIPGKADPVAASNLDVGNEIEIQTMYSDTEDKIASNGNIGIIQKISKVSRKGLFNPITTDGTIIVNGVVASTYSVPFEKLKTQGSSSPYVSFAGIEVVSHHNYLHTMMAPFRALCMLGVASSLGHEHNNAYSNGLNIYSYLGKNLLDFTVETNNALLQEFIILVAFVVFGLLSIVLSLPGVIAILIAIYYFCGKRKKIQLT